ncbi:hypothetical protein KJ840_01950 [Patescibacteria group bacterium]|nr:hypothetical protein [Patescibacteria group bacterium]
MNPLKKILPENGLLPWFPVYLPVINIIACGMYLAELIGAEICATTTLFQGALIFLILYLIPARLKWKPKCNDRCIIIFHVLITLAPAAVIGAGFLGLIWRPTLPLVLGGIFLSLAYLFVFYLLPKWERENYHKQLALN